jgi:hypothetical protein
MADYVLGIDRRVSLRGGDAFVAKQDLHDVGWLATGQGVGRIQASASDWLRRQHAIELTLWEADHATALEIV